MGRTYDAETLNGPAGQHGLYGPVHVVTNTGRPIAGVKTLTFDDDADRGMAEVTAHLTAADGQPVTYRDELDELQPVTVTFRADVRLVPAGPR